jgi:hypothetical protein
VTVATTGEYGSLSHQYEVEFWLWHVSTGWVFKDNASIDHTDSFPDFTFTPQVIRWYAANVTLQVYTNTRWRSVDQDQKSVWVNK